MAATVRLTDRDYDIFASLWRDPKTVDQVFRESTIYSTPFRSLDRSDKRLRDLWKAKYLLRWRYAGNGDGSAPYYYRLSRKGFTRLCDRLGKVLHRPRFDELRHPEHHRKLADCNIHTFVGADAAGLSIEQFDPDGAVRMHVAVGDIIPDSTYVFRLAPEERYTRYFELDNSTEDLVSSSANGNTIEQKILQYEQLFYDLRETFRKTNRDDPFRCPFRVVFFCAKSRVRANNIITLACRLVREPERNMFYAVYLQDFLDHPQPLTGPIFLNNKFPKRPVPLLHQPWADTSTQNTAGVLAAAEAHC